MHSDTDNLRSPARGVPTTVGEMANIIVFGASHLHTALEKSSESCVSTSKDDDCPSSDLTSDIQVQRAI